MEIIQERLPQNLLFIMKARECVRGEIKLQKFLLWVHETVCQQTSLKASLTVIIILLPDLRPTNTHMDTYAQGHHLVFLPNCSHLPLVSPIQLLNSLNAKTFHFES